MLAPILVLVIFILTLLADLLPAETLGMTENPYLAAVILQLLIYAVPTLFWCRIRGREFTPKLRLRPFSPSMLLFLWHAFVFMTALSTMLSILLARAFPEAYGASTVSGAASFAMNERFFDGVYLVVAFAILPAVTEEMLFRGVLVGEYESMGAAAAVTVSAVLFAMSHFSAVRFPVYLCAGLVLGAVLYATRSVIAPMLVHAAYNAVLLLSEKAVLWMVDKQNTSILLLTLALTAAILVSGMLFALEAQHIYRGYAEGNVPSAYAEGKRPGVFARIAEIYFTPTFLLVTLVFLMVTATRA